MLHLKRLLVGINHITVPTASDSPTAYVTQRVINFLKT